jgi:hypothetical protein
VVRPVAHRLSVEDQRGARIRSFVRSADPSSLGTNGKPTVVLASYTNFINGKHAIVFSENMDAGNAARSDEAAKALVERLSGLIQQILASTHAVGGCSRCARADPPRIGA